MEVKDGKILLWKTCPMCGEYKSRNEFYLNKNNNISYFCKKCAAIKSAQYAKNSTIQQKEKAKKRLKQYRIKNKGNIHNWFVTTYNGMRNRNKAKSFGELKFSCEQFEKWVLDNYSEKFYLMFEKYVNSGFDKYEKPSIDRIDDYKGYTFDNMQLLNWRENNEKGRKSNKNKISCAEVAKRYCSKTVEQFDLNGNFISEYESTHEIERKLGYSSSSIARACRKTKENKNTISHGYIWRYKNEL